MPKLGRGFANVIKKTRMELTVRTPYKTLFNQYTDFRVIKARTPEAVLTISNRMPPALYMLAPGRLSVKPMSDTKDFVGEFVHTGGWAIINADNTTEIFVMDAVDVKDYSPIKNEHLVDVVAEDGDIGKGVEGVRKDAQSAFFKNQM